MRESIYSEAYRDWGESTIELSQSIMSNFILKDSMRSIKWPIIEIEFVINYGA
jgi:hypothetical protein